VPFLAFAGAKLTRGIELVMDAYAFDTELKTADLVITGEGRTDAQSAMGKVLAGIGEHAALQQVPVIVLSGTLGPGYETLYEHGISAVFSTIRSADDLKDISGRAEERLQSAAGEILRLITALDDH
jgi:glycerate kinase